MKYIHLISHESDFTIELAKPIDYGEYEIGLAEFSFKNNIQPAFSPYNGLLWHINDAEGDNNFYYFPTGDYYDRISLMERINHEQKKARFIWVDGSAPVLITGPFENEPRLFTTNTNPVLADSETLPIRLDGRIHRQRRIYFKPEPVPVTNVLAYTDIIRPQIVGDTTAPLLRNIRVTSRIDEYQHMLFKKIYFFPLNTQRVNQIRVIIRDDTGETIKLGGARVHLTLALRRHEESLLL